LRERLRRLGFVPEARDVFALRARNEEEDHREPETFLLILHKIFENKKIISLIF
jgi:hypothetical protein